MCISVVLLRLLIYPGMNCSHNDNVFTVAELELVSQVKAEDKS